MKYTKTIRANKSVKPAQRSVRASAVAARRIKADEDIDAPAIDDAPIDDASIDAPADDVVIDEMASTLLFEAEDVAELVSEISGAPVEVTVDEDEVSFAIGEGDEVEVYTVTPDGDEEIVEESTRLRAGARKVAAARKVATRKVAAARKVATPTRRVAASRKVARPSARRVQR